MGLYDSLYLITECLNCRKEDLVEAQTKELEQELKQFEVGDFVSDKYKYLNCITDCSSCKTFYEIKVYLDEKGCLTDKYEYIK